MLPARCLSLCYIFLAVAFLNMDMVCNATNSERASASFNEGIRKYSAKENDTNVNNVTTLLKQGKERYSNFVPIPNPATFKKEVPDNELSSSSYSRGLLHHSDYGLHDYEDGPHHGYAYDYNIHDTDGYGYHGFDHHSPVHFHSGHHADHHVEHHGDHHGGHHYVGHHHKNYDHGLAAKALLWPIAGIALLGAAAAFVTNPVLLQLGVVSGRRKRRDTEEIMEPDDIDVKKWSPKQDLTENSRTNRNDNIQRKSSSNLHILDGVLKRIIKPNMENVTPTIQVSESDVRSDIPKRIKFSKRDNFIPIPLKMKSLKTL